MIFLTKAYVMCPWKCVWTDVNVSSHLCVCTVGVVTRGMQHVPISPPEYIAVCGNCSGNESRACSRPKGSLRKLRFSLRKLWSKKYIYFINVPLKIDSFSLLSLITSIHFVCRERISSPPRRDVQPEMDELRAELKIYQSERRANNHDTSMLCQFGF